MGTPTIIKFKGAGNYGPQQTFSLYRHMDGDPVTQLAVFETIIGRACKMADEYAAEAPHIAERCKITPGTLTGLYIGETTGTFGMAAHIMEATIAATYGEWLYTVDIDAGTITVTDEDENPVDPYTYIERLRDEYQAEHREALTSAINALDGFDFKVLPGERAEA